MEQTSIRPIARCEMHTHRRSASTITTNNNMFRVTAKVVDVLLDPFQGFTLITQPIILTDLVSV